MAERPVKVTVGGNTVEGLEVPITEANERWTELKLEDGSLIRIKVVVTSVIRLPNQFDAEGNPLYFVRTSPVSTVIESPDNLRRPDK